MGVVLMLSLFIYETPCGPPRSFGQTTRKWQSLYGFSSAVLSPPSAFGDLTFVSVASIADEIMGFGRGEYATIMALTLYDRSFSTPFALEILNRMR